MYEQQCVLWWNLDDDFLFVSVVTMMRCLVCVVHLSHWFYICCVFTSITIFQNETHFSSGNWSLNFYFLFILIPPGFFVTFFLFLPFVSLRFTCAVDWSKLYTMRFGFYSNIHMLFTKISDKKWIWKFTFSTLWARIQKNWIAVVFVSDFLLVFLCVRIFAFVYLIWCCTKQIERILWPCRREFYSLSVY